MNSTEHEHAEHHEHDEHHEHHHEHGHHEHLVRITVEVNGRDVHVEFHEDTATGREIRERAGAPLTDDLVRLEHHKPVGGNITLDEKVHLKNGEHFLAVPSGSVS